MNLDRLKQLRETVIVYAPIMMRTFPKLKEQRDE